MRPVRVRAVISDKESVKVKCADNGSGFDVSSLDDYLIELKKSPLIQGNYALRQSIK